MLTCFVLRQQPTTEWDDILCKFGIKTSKQTDKQAEQEKEIERKLDDDFNFDEDDEAVFRRFREQRMAEMQARFQKPRFGEVLDITGQDFVQEGN